MQKHEVGRGRLEAVSLSQKLESDNFRKEAIKKEAKNLYQKEYKED